MVWQEIGAELVNKAAFGGAQTALRHSQNEAARADLDGRARFVYRTPQRPSSVDSLLYS